MQNANYVLSHFNCSENYYRYICNTLITDGVKELAERFKCYWFLDIIASYQSPLQQEDFQVWKLSKHSDGSASIEVTDGNEKVIAKQEIPYTDFEACEASIWVEGNVMQLPSEH